MSDIWDYFKNFFREAADSSASRPIFNEVLERSGAERSAFEAWKGTLPFRRLHDLLAEQYAMLQSNPAGLDPALTFLQTDSSNGFALHFDRLDFQRQDASHFFDLLKEKTLALGYHAQVSSVRTWSEKDWVQAVERHYLKPNRLPAAEDQKLEQRFGNVTIELAFRNDRPHLLTYRATHYADRLYYEPHDFHELMQALLA
jgi:hypothetical protein